MSLHTNLEGFRQYLSGVRRLSVLTVKAYTETVEELINFLNSKGVSDWKKVDSELLLEWISKRREESGVSARTLKKQISALRSWFRYLEKSGVIENNPARKLVNPKTERKLPDYIGESEIQKLIESLQPHDESSYEEWLDWTLFLLLYGAGLRVSEVCNLKEQDFDPGRATLRIYGKGGKEREVPLGNLVIKAIRMVTLLKRAFSDSTALLVLPEKGTPLYPRWIQRRVSVWLAPLKTIRRKSPHTLRHTFATHLLNNNANLLTVKKVLGHSSLLATQVYTHTSVEKLKQEYFRAHPLAKESIERKSR